MKLPPRRYRDTIIRRRDAPGFRDTYGEWIPGTIIETTLRASVQPMTLQDIDSVAGSRLSDRRKVFVPAPDALRAATDAAKADRALIGGELFVVEDSMSWPNHTQALLLRET